MASAENENISYVETPGFLTTSFHIITCVEVPINLLGAYCILYKTPDHMKSVKWQVFNFHVWSCFLDLSINFLTCPFLMFPALAGFPQGILVELGVPTAFQVYLVITTFGVVGVAMICIMENRFHLLFANQSWWNRTRIPYLVINYLYALTFCLYPVLHPPEQKYAIEVVRRRLPEIPPIFFENPVYVLALELKIVAASVLIFAIICINQSFIFIYLLISKFEECSQKMTLSVRTIRLQKRLMKAISIQTFVPLLLLIFPMFYYAPATIFSYYNQKFNNICFITISLHGLVSTIIMLFIHDPYRNFCYRITRKYFRLCFKKQIGVSIPLNSVNITSTSAANVKKKNKKDKRVRFSEL